MTQICQKQQETRIERGSLTDKLHVQFKVLKENNNKHAKKN